MGGEKQRPFYPAGPQGTRRADTNSTISLVVLLTTSDMYKTGDPHS